VVVKVPLYFLFLKFLETSGLANQICATLTTSLQARIHPKKMPKILKRAT